MTILDISCNNLSEVPEWVGLQCAQLTLLRIDNNQISVLPRSLQNLSHLHSFFYLNNKLPKLPIDVRRQGARPIVSFFVNASNPPLEVPEPTPVSSTPTSQPMLPHSFETSIPGLNITIPEPPNEPVQPPNEPVQPP
ncbi:MAG: hypothetical protein Q8P67_09540, partial [archaeon]|nr:hypothetical protein [archaeon]